MNAGQVLRSFSWLISRYCGTRNMIPGSSSVVISSPNRTFLNGKSIRANA